ncbi:TonB-dependent receptor plug domain-containing protein [Rhizorhabdus histidinilytica]
MIVRPESTTKRHGINLYASGVALLCFCSPAFAQSEAPAEQPAAQSAAAEAPQSESLGAGEIIVTASKRAESINKVGLTIAAVSGDQLVKQGISSVQDLTKAVPGLTYARSAFGTPVFTLRGVGYFDTALAASPAVSVYVDQRLSASPRCPASGSVWTWSVLRY